MALVLEVLTFIAMGIGVLPKYFLLDLSIILMIATFLFIIPSFRAQAVIIVLLLTLQMVLGFLNYSLNNINGSVFTIEMMNLAHEAAGAFDSSFIKWGFLVSLILVVASAVILLILLKRIKVKHTFKLNIVFILIVAFSFISVSYVSLYNVAVNAIYEPEDQNDPLYILKSDKNLYETFVFKDTAFKKFGTFAFYYKSVDKLISNALAKRDSTDNAKTYERLTALNSYFKSGGFSERINGYTGSLSGNNVITVMIESGEWFAIDQVLTPTLYALSKSGISAENYISKDKTNHSEAIAILGSYPNNSSFTTNFSSSAKLLENTLSFTLPAILKGDGYTTSYFHNNTGSFYGRKETHSVYGFQNVVTLEDMPDLKGSSGKSNFYDFDRDSDMIAANLDRIAPQDEQFYSFITTLVTHGSYDDLIKYGDYSADLSIEAKNELREKYTVKGLEEYYEKITYEFFADKFKHDLLANGIDLDKQDINNSKVRELYYRYKRYQAAMMDLDKGMAVLLENLKLKGIIEDTVIIMYADHSAYYSDLNYYLKGVDLNAHNAFKDVKLYNVPMFIYPGQIPLFINSNYAQINVNGRTYLSSDFYNYGKNNPLLNSVKLDRFASSFDLLPTILDLLGYRYNKNLYMGNSVFEDTSEVAFISRESGILNDKFYAVNDGNTSGGDLVLNLLYGYESSEHEKTLFNKQAENYLRKQVCFEEMYELDFFRFIGSYEYADIAKLVYKWE